MKVLMISGLVLAASLGAFSPASAQTPPQAPSQFIERLPKDTALLRWLDKVTGRVSNVEAIVGESVRFGGLEIIVRTCQSNPPEETPEEAAFVDVWELKSGQAHKEVFRGWMFASSPGLSAMEHPVFDLWVLECYNGLRGAVLPDALGQ